MPLKFSTIESGMGILSQAQGQNWTLSSRPASSTQQDSVSKGGHNENAYSLLDEAEEILK